MAFCGFRLMRQASLCAALVVAVSALSPLPAQSQTGAQGSAGGLDTLLGLFGGSSSDEFLHPDVAFVLSSEARGSQAVAAHWQIAPGYYLYRDKFSISPLEPSDLEFGEPHFDRSGIIQEDEFFGRMEVYYDDVEFVVPVSSPASSLSASADQGSRIAFEVRYQGCADAGLCYPPITQTVSIDLPPSGGLGAGTTISPGATANPVVSLPAMSEQDRILASLVSGSTGWIVLAFFGFGLLLAFTPCVFPMVPIISSIIVGQGPQLTTLRAFALSLTYVLAVAVTYTLAGVLAGLFGANLQAVFQHPAVIVTFAAAFAALSLAMFGVYQLQVPAAMQQRLSLMSRNWRGGTYTGVAAIGVLSALIIGPCVAAPLAGALLYISQSGDALLGGAALFSLSMGMGIPILIIGTSAGRLLPRAGPWMNVVRSVFGVLLLAVAIWLLERIVPAWIAMLMWGALLIVGSIFLGALDAIAAGVSGWRRLAKGAGIVALVYGIAIVIGGLGGGNDPLRPLHGLSFTGGPGGQQQGLDFQPVRGVEGVRAAIDTAVASGRPVMLDFYADWCVSCKEMERYTFTDPGVQAALAPAVLLKVDVTGYDAQDRALLEKYELFGPPAILFFGLDGAEKRPFRLNGFVNASQFRDHVHAALGSPSLASISAVGKQ